MLDQRGNLTRKTIVPSLAILAALAAILVAGLAPQRSPVAATGPQPTPTIALQPLPYTPIFPTYLPEGAVFEFAGPMYLTPIWYRVIYKSKDIYPTFYIVIEEEPPLTLSEGEGDPVAIGAQQGVILPSRAFAEEQLQTQTYSYAYSLIWRIEGCCLIQMNVSGLSIEEAVKMAESMVK